MLLGLGNPLLDVIAKVDQNFLKKYNLNANDAILANEEHQFLIQHIEEDFKPEYFVGGATQNSMRVAQVRIKCFWTVKIIWELKFDN